MAPARRAYSYGTGLANRHTSMAAPSRATFAGAPGPRRGAAAISRRGSIPPASPRFSSGDHAGAPGGVVAGPGSAGSGRGPPGSGRSEPGGPAAEVPLSGTAGASV